MTSGPMPSPGRRVMLYDRLEEGAAAAEHLREVGLRKEEEEEEEEE